MEQGVDATLEAIVTHMMINGLKDGYAEKMKEIGALTVRSTIHHEDRLQNMAAISAAVDIARAANRQIRQMEKNL